MRPAKWRPHQEFPASGTAGACRHATRLWRIVGRSVRSFLQPQALAALAVSTGAVLGLGAVEGGLLTAAGADAEAAREFAWAYARHNVLPSCVWRSADPALIAASLGLSPDELLRPALDTSTPEAARTALTAAALADARSVLASFMAVGQVVRLVRGSLRASDRFRRDVLRGAEPPFACSRERVVRLCGRQSAMTALSVERYGAEHVLPVLETTDSHHVARWTRGGRLPAVWRVDEAHYGSRHSWAALDVPARWLVRTTTGRRVLVLEADATNPEDTMLIEGPSADLDIEDAARAFRMIARRARAECGPNFRLLRVFLGNPRDLGATGSGRAVALSERALTRKELDVLVDARAPLLHAVRKWARRMGGQVFVDTGSPAFLSLAQRLLAAEGVLVTTADGDGLPRLVYHGDTSATVNATHALVAAGRVDPARCCVLVHEKEGLEALADLQLPHGRRMDVVCAAAVHDDVLREVRVWTRLGHTPEQIQGALDERWGGLVEL